MNVVICLFCCLCKVVKVVFKVYVLVLQCVIQVYQVGNFDDVECLYGEVLDMQVVQFDVLYFLGVFSYQCGCSDEVLVLIGLVLKIILCYFDVYNNLGNVYKECGWLVDVEVCYCCVLECGLGYYNVLSNLVVVLEVQEWLDDVFEVYIRLLQQVLGYVYGYYWLGLFLCNYVQNEEYLEQLVECFCEVFCCDDCNVCVLEGVGIVLYMFGCYEVVVEVYCDWLVCEFDNLVLCYMFVFCGVVEVLLWVVDDYVCDVFDGFVDSFDEQLFNNFGYCVLEVFMGFLDEVLFIVFVLLDVFDVGCGIGLCVLLVCECVCQLVGVDLFGGMVDKVCVCGGYDVFEVVELIVWFSVCYDVFDLVILVDILVYFGELGLVFGVVVGVLWLGGWVGFMLEVIEGEGELVEFIFSGCYCYLYVYVECVLQVSGFDQIMISFDILCCEVGKLVLGWVVCVCCILMMVGG